MMDDERRDEDEGLDEASQAEADEARLAAQEMFEADDADDGWDEEDAAVAEIEAALAEAQANALKRRAAWSLVHKEHFAFLFANCFFFAGALAAWWRVVPGEQAMPAMYITGLDTIRGAVIFALSIYGFWTVVFNVWYRQLRVWPFLLNALLALWVGIGEFTRNIGSARWDAANDYVESLESKSILDKILTPLSVVPPGAWLLTAGGALVLIILIKGVLGGASASRAGAEDDGGTGGRRRRR